MYKTIVLGCALLVSSQCLGMDSKEGTGTVSQKSQTAQSKEDLENSQLFAEAMKSLDEGKSYLEGNDGGLKRRPGLSEQDIQEAVNLIVEGMRDIAVLPVTYMTTEKKHTIIDIYFYHIEKLTNSHTKTDEIRKGIQNTIRLFDK